MSKLKRTDTVQICDTTPNCPAEVTAQVREALLAEMMQQPDDFEPCDISNFAQSDWNISRYLMRNKMAVQQTIKMMLKTARWRKQQGMVHWRDTDFLADYYTAGAVFPYTRDLYGNTVLYVRVRYYQKHSKLAEYMKKFFTHLVNRVDMEIDGRGVGLVADCTGAGVSNADFDLLWFLIHCLVNYNPKCVNYACVYELPWILKGLYNIAYQAVPAEYSKLVIFADRHNITQLIAKENLPDFLGGTCEVNYRRAPKGCITREEIAEKYELTAKELAQFAKGYDRVKKEMDDEQAKLKAQRDNDANNNDKKKKLLRKQSSLMQLWYFLKRTDGPQGENDTSSVTSSPLPISPNKDDPFGPALLINQTAVTSTTDSAAAASTGDDKKKLPDVTQLSIKEEVEE